MASHSDTKPESPVGRGASPDSDAPPKPRYDEKIEGDSFEVLRRYQEVTLPPNARLKLLSAPVPVVPPEELQDTVPPNARVAAPAQGAAPASWSASSTSETPVVDASRSQDTLLLPRVRRKQRLRTIVIAAVVAAALFAAAGFWLSQPSQDAATTEADQQPATTPAQTTPTSAVAPVVTAKPAPPEAVATQASAPPTEPSAQVSAQPTPAKSPASSVTAPARAPSNGTGEKSQPVPATTPKPVAAPGTTHDSGSAFDGLMRPPSD